MSNSTAESSLRHRGRKQQKSISQDADRAGYDSGIGEDSNSDDNHNDSGSDTGSTNDEDRPITGFAVAGSRRNAEFHELFPSVPEDDYLIEGMVTFDAPSQWLMK